MVTAEVGKIPEVLAEVGGEDVAGGAMTLRETLAPQSARDMPFGQQPALVQ
jgi:hypothetical protein